MITLEEKQGGIETSKTGEMQARTSLVNLKAVGLESWYRVALLKLSEMLLYQMLESCLTEVVE